MFLINHPAYLRLHGIKAREHPVFTELTRVKQYFDKIKMIETPATRTMTIDKAATKRFLEPGLVGASCSILHSDSAKILLPPTCTEANHFQGGSK
jgi:hypothetical protein